MWIIFAFSGPIFFALSTHIDKYLVEKYFKNSDIAVLMVFTAIIDFIMLPFIFFFHPETFLLPKLSIIVMISSGLFYMGAMLFYLRAIQTSEASIIGPLFQTTILFIFILSYFFLGEKLSLSDGFGVLLIAIGAIILSLDTSFHFGTLKLKTLFTMLLCTFILASSSVIFKYFAIQEQNNFWNIIFWNYIGNALFGIGILLIPKYWLQFTNLIKTNSASLLVINGINETINLVGGLGVRFASLLAPIVLVSAIASTSTLFVFIFGIILTVFLPNLARENISKRNLFQKGLVALLVTAGVILAQI